MDSIETPRLRLRPMRLGDAADLFALHSDPDVMRYLAGEPPESVDVQRERIRRHVREYYARYGFGLYAVENRRDGIFLGRAGFLVWDFDGVIETEVAYTLRRSEWGNGYATEAARAVRDYGFAVLKKPRLISLIMPENIGSVRVAEKLGAKFERMIDVMGHQARLYVHAPPMEPPYLR